MARGFWGGVYEGAMGAINADLAYRRMGMDQEKHDAEMEQVNRQKALGQQFEKLGTAEEAAQQANQTATTNVDAALTENANAVANASEAAPAVPVSDADKEIIRKAYGMKPPEAIAYDFANQRASALMKAGDVKGAEAMRTQAREQTAGAFINAMMNKDGRTAADIYNLSSPSRKIASIKFDDNGDALVQDAMPDGSNGAPRKVTQYDAIAGALAHMDPKSAANFVMTKFKSDEQMARLVESINARQDLQNNRFADQLNNALMMLGVKSGLGGGASGTGKGSGKTGSGAPGEFLEDKDFFEQYVPKDGNGAVPEWGGAASTFKSQLIAQNPEVFGKDLAGNKFAATLAVKLAKGEAHPVPELGNDGIWRLKAKFGTNTYALSQETDPYAYAKTDEKGNPLPGTVPKADIDKAEFTFIDNQRKADPQRTDKLAEIAIDPNRYNALFSAVRSGAITDPAELQRAQQDLSLASMIRRHLGDQVDPRGAATAAAPVPFAEQQLADAKKYGVEQDSPLTSFAKGAYNTVAGGVAKANAAMRDNDFKSLMYQINRTGRLEQGQAMALYETIKADPAYLQKIPPELQNAILVATGKNSFK